ncbi:MAG: 50S ribosomal protein L29 [Flavobacteriales bacterium]|nr:50S ribosomal protein L29 [Flavobacteriales bacterium]
MKQSEIRELSNAELVEKIENLQNELTKMKINHGISPLENPMLIRKNRKDIARLLTEKRRRELNA